MVTGVEAINPRTSSNRNSSAAKCSAACGAASAAARIRSTSSHDKVSAVSALRGRSLCRGGNYRIRLLIQSLFSCRNIHHVNHSQ